MFTAFAVAYVCTSSSGMMFRFTIYLRSGRDLIRAIGLAMGWRSPGIGSIGYTRQSNRDVLRVGVRGCSVTSNRYVPAPLEASHPSATGRSNAPRAVGYFYAGAWRTQGNDTPAKPRPGHSCAMDSRDRSHRFDEPVQNLSGNVELIAQ